MKPTRDISVWVSILIITALSLAHPAWPKEPIAPANAKITFIYISAWNCPPCIAWARQYKPIIEAGPMREHVIFREIEAYRYQSIGEDGLWPEDLRWVRDELGLIRGTPRWVIVSGGEIDISGRGREWRRIWLRLKELVIAARELS